ncbi:hypothetical protein Goari_006277, partial [Gossypium aridum]|nr:hypothetical protein [Gossypium aridum]
NCLGALEGTHIKITVPKVDKPRYRTQKDDIETNMLGTCTPDMQFVYVLPSWEGFIIDGKVLRDVIKIVRAFLRLLDDKDIILISGARVTNQSHKEDGQSRHCSFPYYDQLTSIYAKDRATGKDAQTTGNNVEEINVEDVATTMIPKEESNYHRCEADVSLDKMDVSTTQSQPSKPNQDNSTFSKKKKNRFMM